MHSEAVHLHCNVLRAQAGVLLPQAGVLLPQAGVLLLQLPQLDQHVQRRGIELLVDARAGRAVIAEPRVEGFDDERCHASPNSRAISEWNARGTRRGTEKGSRKSLEP